VQKTSRYLETIRDEGADPSRLFGPVEAFANPQESSHPCAARDAGIRLFADMGLTPLQAILCLVRPAKPKSW